MMEDTEIFINLGDSFLLYKVACISFTPSRIVCIPTGDTSLLFPPLFFTISQFINSS